MGETKLSRSPKSLLPGLRECELRSSAQRVTAPQRRHQLCPGFDCRPHRSAIDQPVLMNPATDPGRSAYEVLAAKIQSCKTTLSSDVKKLEYVYHQ
jgi:hypothetical protein